MSIGTLLVYGTLRPNRGATVALPGYAMFSMGPYPAIKKGKPDDVVLCERIEVRDEKHLAALDAYECCDGNGPNDLYHREKVGDDWVYVYNHSVDGRELIGGGDWLDHVGHDQGSNARLATLEDV